MTIQTIEETQKNNYNEVVTHPLQAYEWGEFRKQTGIKVIRKGVFEQDKIVNGFQLTIHPIPKTPWTIGYIPKGTLPTQEIVDELMRIGKEERCIFIQLEPNIEIETSDAASFYELQKKNTNLKPSAHPLFTKNTFILDLTKSEDELLKNMHPKTRYNIKVAKRHNVEIKIEEGNQAFQEYLALMKETTIRQKFYAHTPTYHTKMWETLKTDKKTQKGNNNLSANLLIATYQPPDTDIQPVTLASWILFTFHKTLYYPYGASSNLYRNVMASNLIMWEAILFGKKLGMESFDMWGSLGENPDPNDTWYGFHRLKSGYGPRLAEFLGSYDLIINPGLYTGYKLADKLRWFMLKLKK